MIGVKIQGRLGNQLFQYAFIFAASKQLNTSFYIDQTNQKLIINNYFDIPTQFSFFLETHIFSVVGHHNLFSHRLKNLFYTFINNYKVPNEVSFEADAIDTDVFSAIKDKTLFQGFFLSETYFTTYALTIRKLFKVKKNFRAAYDLKYAKLFQDKKIITIHIRKDDYSNLGHLNLGGEDLSLPITYYHKILPQLQSNNVLFVLISDDIEFVKNEFAYLNNKLVSEDTMIYDFQHLLRADICIISNSTFSWWGAWLNNNSGKKIFAPEHFMGHRINKTWPVGIYPSEWNLVNVNNPVIN